MADTIPTADSIKNEINKFSHIIDGRAKFSEVDSFGVVHNVQYFYWLEWARTEYLRNLEINMNPNTFINEFPLMVVHAEMDYFNPLRFNENYEIFTRISKVKDSSLQFENIAMGGRQAIVKGTAILVCLSPDNYRPRRIPDEIREKIKSFEKGNCLFINE